MTTRQPRVQKKLARGAACGNLDCDDPDCRRIQQGDPTGNRAQRRAAGQRVPKYKVATEQQTPPTHG